MADVDWKSIEIEYITTQISQRAVARKYDVSMRTVQDKAKADKWMEKRDNYRITSTEAVIKEVIQNDVSRMARILNLSDRAVTLLEEAIEELRKSMCTHKKKIKTDTIDQATGKKVGETTIEIEDLVMVDGVIDVFKLYQITQAIKNLKDIQMLMSDAEKREQEARIKKTENEAVRTTVGEGLDNNQYGIALIPEIEPTIIDVGGAADG